MGRRRQQIRIIYDPVVGRFFATDHYSMGLGGDVMALKPPQDVTNDIARAVIFHGVTFEATARPRKSEPVVVALPALKAKPRKLEPQSRMEEIAELKAE